MMTETIRNKILLAVQQAPMLSISASRLMQVTSQPDYDIREVIDVVQTDANLTARVLKVVNSAAFGLVTKINSLERAITLLGERVVVGIAIGDSAGHLFHKTLKGYESGKGDLWRHDLRTAIASRLVAQKGQAGITVDLAFTAGLLHDLGKAFISDFLENTAGAILEQIENHQSASYLEAETAILGMNHTEAGDALAELWNLPAPLRAVIRYHHAPDQAPDEFKPLVYCVHLGDIVAMMGGCGTGADTLQYTLDPGYIRFLDLPPNKLAEIMLDVEDEFSKIESSLQDTKENVA